MLIRKMIQALTSTSTLLLHKALQYTLDRSYAHNKARPQHREVRAPLFSNSAWVLSRRAEL